MAEMLFASIIELEIYDEEERQTFFRDYRCVHTKMQDPLEEDGEQPIIEGRPSVVSLGL
jgi:hypothetical protein